MHRIGLMGLGTMGSGIARNLLKHGFPLHVYNRTREKAQPLLAEGAQWADSPRAAAAQADVILSVVGDDAASRAVWLGPEGALAGARPGSVVVECSTLSLDWIRELGAQAQQRGLEFVDAPLGGSKPAAEAGTLNLFVGAEPAALDSIRPVLQAFSSHIIHFGPPGSGITYKLINNMMAAVQLAALGEGVAMAEKAGLNMETVTQAVSAGATSSPIVKGKVQNVVARHFREAHFALRWMHKDLTYALRAADALGVPMPAAAAAHEIYRMAMQKGLTDMDWSAVTEVVRGR
jgi:3-hydroxyisobutyrate dehydrogenase